MNYLSICSGIEAASTGWHHLGFKPLGFSEIEPFPSAVLAHHYPDVPNFGDMTKHKEWILNERLDILVGGCPCQAFSVAGARRSLDDERGNLTLTFCNIANQFSPRFVLYENVPGILNTKDNAFGCLLAGLAGLDDPLETEKGKWPGNGLVIGGRRRVAWVTLDAQYFGVPQRRRRIFVLAVDAQSVADSPALCPSKILSIGTSLRRDTPPRRKTGEEAAATTGGGVECGVFQQSSMLGRGTIGWETTGLSKPVKTQVDGRMICFGIDEECNASDNHFGPLLRGGQGGTRQAVAFQQNTRDEVRLIGGEGTHKGALAAQAGMKQTNYIMEGFTPSSHGDNRRGLGTLRASGGDLGGGSENLVTIMAHGQANAEIRSDGEPPSLTCNHETQIVAYSMITANTGANGLGLGLGLGLEINPTLDRAQPNAVAGAGPRPLCQVPPLVQVRRLTPEECEILQGFPVGYTDIKLKGKPTPDGPRYKALGNSMCTSVMRYIGERIQQAGVSQQ